MFESTVALAELEKHRKILFGNGELGIVAKVNELERHAESNDTRWVAIDSMLRGDGKGQPGLCSDVRDLARWLKILTAVLVFLSTTMGALLLAFLWSIFTGQVTVQFP